MINGQLKIIQDTSSTLQFECEECVGRGWTENLSSLPTDVTIKIIRRK